MPIPSRPGPRNLITDVGGVLVGNAEDARARTGATVVLAERPAVCACDVRGGGPGTRETDLLEAHMLVQAVDAVCLSGGSVYGLAAADGVVVGLGANGRGFNLGPGLPPAPIVPGAILFDLANGGDKDWGEAPPYARLGREALENAALEFRLGAVGAGLGAAAGGVRGGLGSASLLSQDGIAVGALAAVNSFGSVLIPGSRAFWAAPYEIDGEFGGVPTPSLQMADPDDWGASKASPGLRQNTTLVVVAVNATLTPSQAKRVAIMAQDGLARAIRPVHAPFDGDVVFVLATGDASLPEPEPFALARLGERAASCVARAIARGVFEAKGEGWGAPAWRDLA